ncbi:hypothetical protein B4113_3888 [Geobacillus sp. B4113_201601]|nr:hypothetical protein B4113_3888 [Geobacillus sp. B4113_201601]
MGPAKRLGAPIIALAAGRRTRKVRGAKRRKAGRKQREAAQSTSFASSDIIKKKGGTRTSALSY